MKSKLGAYIGGALQAAARTYPYVYRAVIEAIQNALDAGALCVSVTINLKRSTIEITDDGNGVTKARLDQALQNVFRSQKERGSLGQFGIGLMAFLDKCDQFTFTSCPAPQRVGYLEWSFKCREILEAEDEIEVTAQPREKYSLVSPPDERPSWHNYAWRTRLFVEGFVSDRRVHMLHPEKFEAEILDHFNELMKKQHAMVQLTHVSEDGTTVSRVVMPRNFEGRALKVSQTKSEDGGLTEVRLHLSPRIKGSKGVVRVGVIGDPHRMRFDTFARSTGLYSSGGHHYLDPDVVSGLTSGIFEGELLNEKATLLPDRSSFADDNALVDFCIAINEWYIREGADHVEAARDAKEDDRFKRIVERSSKNLDGLIDQHPELQRLLQTFKRGHIGKGHAEPKRGKVLDLSIAATSLNGISGGSTKPGGTTRREQPTENTEHRPTSVEGGRRARQFVTGGSKGLLYRRVSEPNSNTVCGLNLEIGALEFNDLHELYATCDRNDRVLGAYMEYVAAMTLWLHTYPPDQKLLIQDSYYVMLESFVHLLLSGDKVPPKPAKR